MAFPYSLLKFFGLVETNDPRRLRWFGSLRGRQELPQSVDHMISGFTV